MLVNCPECHHMVSSGASYCPNCGYRLNMRVRWTLFWVRLGLLGCLGLVILTILGIAILGVFHSFTRASTKLPTPIHRYNK